MEVNFTIKPAVDNDWPAIKLTIIKRRWYWPFSFVTKEYLSYDTKTGYSCTRRWINAISGKGCNEWTRGELDKIFEREQKRLGLMNKFNEFCFEPNITAGYRDPAGKEIVK